MKTRASDTRLVGAKGVWERFRRFVGRHADGHPALSATIIVIIAFSVIVLLVIDSNHHANRASSQARSAVVQVRIALKDVSKEQALITKYLRESNPAGRRRIKLECEEVNARFSNLGKILDSFHPPGTVGSPTSELITSLKAGLRPVDCARLAKIGPNASQLK